MREKKQIVEEMARHIPARIFVYDVSENTANLDELRREIVALHLYRAGYRKQSEVAREIFEEIEKTVNACVVDESFIKPAYFEFRKFNEQLAELKKKYTEAEAEPPVMKGGAE